MYGFQITQDLLIKKENKGLLRGEITLSIILKRHFHFNSSNGVHKVHGIVWQPEDREVVGVVQIIHGMAEFIDRYDSFARFLCSEGFVVAGEDHIGHGQTVENLDELGFFGQKNGMESLINDNYRLKKHMEQEYADLPYYILGHSLGSHIAKVFLTRYSNEVDGAILMGTSHKSALVLQTGKVLTYIIALFKKWTYRSTMIHKLAFGGFNKKFKKKARTEVDWLTRDEGVIDAYLSNPRCTFVYTVAAYRDIFSLLLVSGKSELLHKIRPDLPVLLISGKKDPCGNFGRGVQKVYDELEDAGLENVSMMMYEGARHEVLNEINKEKVFADIAGWFETEPKKNDMV